MGGGKKTKQKRSEKEEEEAEERKRVRFGRSLRGPESWALCEVLPFPHPSFFALVKEGHSSPLLKRKERQKEKKEEVKKRKSFVITGHVSARCSRFQ